MAALRQVNRYLSLFIEVSTMYICVFSLTVNALATLMLMPYLSELKIGTGIRYKIITYISLISYSLYLLNYSLVKDIIVRNGIVKPLMHFNITQNEIFLVSIGYFFYWLLVIFGAILMYKHIELPFIKLRDKKLRKTGF